MSSLKISRSSLILILGMLSTISPFAIDLYLPAFPEIARYLNTDVTKIALSLSSYFIGLALGQIFYGPLLDRFGRKIPVFLGLTIFMLASLTLTRAPNIEIFIALRFIQAVGGCVAQVASMAMVRDFFPVKEAAKVFSLVMLVIGVSPLLAPTIGGFITTTWGWQWVFYTLAFMAIGLMSIVAFCLPEGRAPDPTVSLGLKPILTNFKSILKVPQFYIYGFAGAFSFSGLMVYVASSPIIFMDIYQVSAEIYGGIFALVTGSFILGSQINVLLAKRLTSESIFQKGIILQASIGALFFIASYLDVLNLTSTIIFFMCFLLTLGILSPNATALALAPFEKNAGSASALVGFIQIGIASIFSAGVGLTASKELFPVIAILGSTSIVALLVLSLGKKKQEAGNEHPHLSKD